MDSSSATNPSSRPIPGPPAPRPAGLTARRDSVDKDWEKVDAEEVKKQEDEEWHDVKEDVEESKSEHFSDDNENYWSSEEWVGEPKEDKKGKGKEQKSEKGKKENEESKEKSDDKKDSPIPLY
ncbi:hypothetical protein F5Y02DRAFT_412536 [Annulohypoxylon stygium]|nr:hypothetical protein F5Y02DRAFT_412536 [Annulohypoxylon stygium]